MSSVLSRDVKQFGKKFMFDSNEETCWNSDQVTLTLIWPSRRDVSCGFLILVTHLTLPNSFLKQGESQWVVLEFPQPVKVSELRLQFQGGFSGKSCKLQGQSTQAMMAFNGKTLKYRLPMSSEVIKGWYICLCSWNNLLPFWNCFVEWFK